MEVQQLRNVEMKARVRNLSSVLSRLEQMGAGKPTDTLKQADTYFNVPSGRLKLRELEDSNGGRSELIFYNRPDEPGPKMSEYEIVALEDPDELKRLLTTALGVQAVVRKERSLFLIDITRIHLDQVEQLGSFLEIEVVMPENFLPERAESIAGKLIDDLGIAEAELVEGSYLDLMLEAGGTPPGSSRHYA
jgi:predicted adenylyl cyclase CyaB